jgi:hypothetical protein
MTKDWYPGSRRYRFIGGPWDGTKHRIGQAPPHLVVAVPQKFKITAEPITPDNPPAIPKFTYELRCFHPHIGKPIFVYCDPALDPYDRKVQAQVREIDKQRATNIKNLSRKWKSGRHGVGELIAVIDKILEHFTLK